MISIVFVERDFPAYRQALNHAGTGQAGDHPSNGAFGKRTLQFI
jgi:hypothetical protein